MTKSLLSQRWLRRFTRNKSAAAGTILVLLVVGMAVAAPVLSSTNPIEIFSGEPLSPPGGANLLGTDNIGRDIFSRIVYGSRASLTVAAGVVVFSLTVGVFLGLLAGYYGGFADKLIMFAMDSIMAFPTLILAMAISAVIGAGLTNIIIAVGVVSIPAFARLTRSQVMAVRKEDYILSARAIGAKDRRIIILYVLANIISPLIVQSSFVAAQAILFEAALSFLGVGVQPPTPAWGAMLRDGYGYLGMAPWVSIAPGAAIIAAVLGFNLFGDALRDSLDVTLADATRR